MDRRHPAPMSRGVLADRGRRHGCRAGAGQGSPAPEDAWQRVGDRGARGAADPGPVRLSRSAGTVAPVSLAPELTVAFQHRFADALPEMAVPWQGEEAPA